MLNVLLLSTMMLVSAPQSCPDCPSIPPLVSSCTCKDCHCGNHKMVATDGKLKVVVNSSAVDFVKVEPGKVFVKVKAARVQVKEFRTKYGPLQKLKAHRKG